MAHFTGRSDARCWEGAQSQPHAPAQGPRAVLILQPIPPIFQAHAVFESFKFRHYPPVEAPEALNGAIEERRKHALAVAVAAAAATKAAVAAANAAAEVVRLTIVPYEIQVRDQHFAAVKIQSDYRGYLVDFVIYLGDVITANNIMVKNASFYWDQALSPTRARGIPWSSIFGNHDDARFEWPMECFSETGIPQIHCPAANASFPQI